ncbi:beta-N-acetylglucosaminidase, partial [Streptomyces cellulosae]
MAVALVVIAAGVSLGLWAASGDDGGSTGPAARSSQGGAAAPTTSPDASPSRSYALSEAPRTIPAVRDHTPARGPGWRPEKGNRVVVDDPALADEGRLVAGELGLSYAGEKDDKRAGDLRLTLNDDKGANPESYVMTVRDGRVEI